MIDSEQWFQLHTAYLQSSAWHAKHDAVVDRDGSCRAQIEGCTGRAEQAHHLHYRHWRNEPLFDLVAVCGSCHEAITQMDRGASPDEVLAQIRTARRNADFLIARSKAAALYEAAQVKIATLQESLSLARAEAERIERHLRMLSPAEDGLVTATATSPQGNA